MKDSPWLYLVLGAVLLYWLWGLQFTVAIEGDGIRVGGHPVPLAGAGGKEQIDWALVESLPMGTPK
jgi:hypothetical protein